MTNQGVASNAFILNPKHEILLLKRSPTDEAFPGEWELPGGGIDYGETPEESLAREVKEECGLNVKVNNPLSVNTFYFGKIHVIEITFHCEIMDNSFEVKLSSEHTEYKWTPLDIKDTELNEYMTKVVETSVAAFASHK